MNYNRLGNSGLLVSELSLGSWVTFGSQVDDKLADEMMSYAYDNGINFFDNAEVYAQGQSEIVMGKVLKKKKWDRSTYLVSSKVFWGGDKPNQKGLSRKHVTEGCNAALKRLQVDYLDLFYCHRPDRNTPIEETVWTMHNLICSGKILYWGTSEWSAQEITAAHAFAMRNNLIGPVMEQPQYNMFHRDRVELEYKRVYKDFGLGTTIWSPLASGLLTGKYNKKSDAKSGRLNMKGYEWLKEKTLNEEKLQKVEKLQKLAKKLNISLTHLALIWCLKNENVSTVILGASKIEQLKENMNCLQHKEKLTDKVLFSIEEILQNKPEQDWF
ncbi:MAG: aldo/keto reductase [Chitinophagaceae bacterium]|nr:MAG: aldo/keto reductase [Chitinophagaceae bacterium]